MTPRTKARVKTPITDLVRHLKDPDYKRTWVANIAMAYIDNERWYREKMKENIGKVYLSRVDKHRIANNAAEYFLDLLCKKPRRKTK